MVPTEGGKRRQQWETPWGFGYDKDEIFLHTVDQRRDGGGGSQLQETKA